MDFKPISGQIAPDSDKLGLVDPHRLLTWVWSTPKQAIPLILKHVHVNGTIAQHIPAYKKILLSQI